MLWNTSILPAGSPFVALRKDFERQLGVEQSPTLAAMTVTEHSDRWTVSIDLPGLKVEDINITFNEGSLIIEGERQAPSADGAKELYSDRSFSKFRRVLKVREAIDQNAVDYCVMQSLSIAFKLTCKMSPEIPLPGARLWSVFLSLCPARESLQAEAFAEQPLLTSATFADCQKFGYSPQLF